MEENTDLGKPFLSRLKLSQETKGGGRGILEAKLSHGAVLLMMKVLGL